MDLNGEWNGIPKKILLPAGVVVIVGGYIFIKRYRAAKAATSTTAAATPANPASGSGTDSAYGPMPGNGMLNVMLPQSQADSANQQDFQSVVKAQNQYIISALQALHNDVGLDIYQTAGTALATPNAVPAIQMLEKQGWVGQAEKGMGTPWPTPSTTAGTTPTTGQ